MELLNRRPWSNLKDHHFRQHSTNLSQIFPLKAHTHQTRFGYMRRDFLVLNFLWNHLLFISAKGFFCRPIYLLLKNEKSRRVAESRSVCVGLYTEDQCRATAQVNELKCGDEAVQTLKFWCHRSGKVLSIRFRIHPISSTYCKLILAW